MNQTLRRIAADWLPPKVARGVQRLRRSRNNDTVALPPTAPELEAARATTPAPKADNDPRWERLTERTLAGLESCDPIYRPTTFWTPGVQRLLGEMDTVGLDKFKTWPEAFFWFYPVYGRRIPRRVTRRMLKVLASEGPQDAERWLRPAMRGVHEAWRDYDAARLAWDQQNWPMDLESYGESEIGEPTQTFSLTPDSDARLTKPYLNYLLCLAALSRHVAEPPRSFLELGGGFGVLGEIVMSRDDAARYVNCDIPPLLTVSSYYLTERFGHDRVLTFDDRVPDVGPLKVDQSACLPNWRIADLIGDFDVFVNSFSFQEMEPPVVEHYVDTVAKLGVSYVVSLNSREGKPISEAGSVGVKDQVTSAMIVELFSRRGYEICGRYNQPLIRAAGELVVLRRR